MQATPWLQTLKRFQLLSRCLAILAVWCVAATAWACNVPVFRYALERWAPDPYHLVVFYDGDEAVGEAVRAMLQPLEDQPINLLAEAVDVQQIAPDDWRLSDVEIDLDHLPWAVLRSPPGPGQVPRVAWSGKLDEESLALLTHSNVRQEVIRRLLTGESAVWVFVASGDLEKDQAARETLERYLAEAKTKLRIPGLAELDYSPIDAGSGNEEPPAFEGPSFQDPEIAIPLKVDFSLISLSRDNPAEAGFLAMLLGSEPDLNEYAEEPMVFPMFGQGRALWALVGKGINAENIFESCAFLTGPCSCQVKSMNPGTDMLMAFDWWSALEGRVPPPPQISPDMLTGVAPVLDDEQDASTPDPLATVTDPGSVDAGGTAPSLSALQEGAAGPAGGDAPHDGPQRQGAPIFVVTGAVLGGLVLVVAAATAVLMGKKQ